MPTTEVTQTADVLGPAALVPLTAPQPPARLIVDPPLPGPLSEGRVYTQYRALAVAQRRGATRSPQTVPAGFY